MNDSGKDFYDTIWDSNNSNTESKDVVSNDLEKEDRDKDEEIEKDNNKIYSCNYCKTSFYSSNDVISCPYCQKKDYTDISMSMENDYFYISFNNNMDEAINCYKKSIKFLLFIPFFFKKKSVYNNMKKVYIPLELYNSKVSGEVSFFGADENSINKQKETRKYECRYEVNVDYDNVYISKYSKINEDGYNVFNYNYALISPYEEGIIKDEYIIYPDLKSEEINNKLNNKLIKNSLNMSRSNINHQLKKLKENKLILKNKDKFNVLVPVYLLNLEYKNKKCLFIMNGQNGEYYFNSDKSLFNILFFAISLFLVIFLIAFLFAYFL